MYFKVFRQFLRAAWIKWGRLQIKATFIRNISGEYGITLRTGLLKKHFGYTGENLRIYEGFKFRNLHKVMVGDNVVIGIDNFFQAGGGIEIGSETVIGPNVRIWTQNQKCASLEEPYRVQGLQYLKVKIGRNVWIGPSAFIMPGVDIGDGCMITPGSLVEKGEYPAWSIISGNPAKIIGSRLNTIGDRPGARSAPGLSHQVPQGDLNFMNIPK